MIVPSIALHNYYDRQVNAPYLLIFIFCDLSNYRGVLSLAIFYALPVMQLVASHYAVSVAISRNTCIIYGLISISGISIIM